jgi:multisubunit Na+/H+ antiporter MnhB subunit
MDAFYIVIIALIVLRLYFGWKANKFREKNPEYFDLILIFFMLTFCSFISPKDSIANSGEIFSESHPYHTIYKINEYQIQSYISNNRFVYFYLLVNHNTNKIDTIRAFTKQELREKVKEATGAIHVKPFWQTLSVIMLIILILLILKYILK